jgi:hypothetical protein
MLICVRMPISVNASPTVPVITNHRLDLCGGQVGWGYHSNKTQGVH